MLATIRQTYWLKQTAWKLRDSEGGWSTCCYEEQKECWYFLLGEKRKVWRSPLSAWCCRCLSWPGHSPSQICAWKDLASPGAWSGRREILKAKNRMTTFSSRFFPCCSWNVINYFFSLEYIYGCSTHFYLCHVGKFMLRYILCLEEMCIGAVGFILG